MAKKAELKSVLTMDMSPFAKSAAKALTIGKSLAKQLAANPLKFAAVGSFLVAEKGARAFAAGIGKLGSIAGSAVRSGLMGFAAAVPLATAGLVAGTVRAYNFGSEMQDLHDRTGIAVDRLVVMTQALHDSGIEMEALVPAMSKMNKALIGAQNGGSATAFEQIGLHVKDLIALDPGEQFEKIGAAISKMENPAARAAGAMAIFGKSGANLLSFFADGSAMQTARDSIGKQAQLLEKNAEVFDRISDRLGRAGVKLRGFFVGVASRLAPIVDGLTEMMDKIDLAGAGEKLADALKESAKWIIMSIKEPGKMVNFLWQSMKLGGAEFINWLASGLVNAVGMAWNAIKPTLESAMTAIRDSMLPELFRPKGGVQLPGMDTNHALKIIDPDQFGEPFQDKGGKWHRGETMREKAGKARDALGGAEGIADDMIARVGRTPFTGKEWIGQYGNRHAVNGNREGLNGRASEPGNLISTSAMGVDMARMMALTGNGMMGAGLMGATGFAAANNRKIRQSFDWRLNGYGNGLDDPKFGKSSLMGGSMTGAAFHNLSRGAYGGSPAISATAMRRLVRANESESMIRNRHALGNFAAGDAAKLKKIAAEQARKEAGQLTDNEALVETAKNTKKIADTLTK